MIKRKNAVFLAFTCALVLISGCGKKDEEPVVNYDMVGYSEEELEYGKYYVKTANTFYPVAQGTTNVNLETVDAEDVNEANVFIPRDKDASRFVWYWKDDAQIPTLYQDDTLIFTTKDSIPTSFVFERYEDLGYTIGIGELSANSGGKYEVVASDKNLKLDSSVIDALNTIEGAGFGSNIVLDKIGGVDITSENVTRIGTIYGLTADKQYDIDAYVGSDYSKLTCVADTHAFGSFEWYESADYSYSQSNYINVSIPNYFLSGYYYINGCGLFRYVNKPRAEGTQDINFNEPYYVAQDENGNYLTQKQLDELNQKDVETDEEDIDEMDNVYHFKQTLDCTQKSMTVTLTYKNRNVGNKVVKTDEYGVEIIEEEEELKVPIVSMKGADQKTYNFKKNERLDNSLVCQVDMPLVGDWIVSAVGLENYVFDCSFELESGHSDNLVHTGSGTAQMVVYVDSDYKDATFSFTWENDAHASSIVIENEDGERFGSGVTDEDVTEKGYGNMDIHVGKCKKGYYTISVTGEELGRVSYSVSGTSKSDDDADDGADKEKDKTEETEETDDSSADDEAKG